MVIGTAVLCFYRKSSPFQNGCPLVWNWQENTLYHFTFTFWT